MKLQGNKPQGLETGNAWDLHQPGEPTNWIVGSTPHIPFDSLRFMEQGGRRAKNVCVKWFVHQPGDPPEWGTRKPTSSGRTISILAGDGEFELEFFAGGERRKVTLERTGDFAVWGPGLEHSWRPLRTSTVVTVRWEPE